MDGHDFGEGMDKEQNLFPIHVHKRGDNEGGHDVAERLGTC
jgi:hypothetical protein